MLHEQIYDSEFLRIVNFAPKRYLSTYAVESRHEDLGIMNRNVLLTAQVRR